MHVQLNTYWWYYPAPKLAVGYVPDIDVPESKKQDLGNQIATERGDFAIPPDLLVELYTIQTELTTYIEPPKPVDTGFKKVIPTQEVFDFRTFADKLGVIQFQYREIVLPPKGIDAKSMHINISHLSKATRDAIKKVDDFAYFLSMKDFVSRHGQTDDEAQAIIGRKQRVFISYRSRIRKFATAIHSELKNYARGVFFTPFVDWIDLGPGIWLQKLEKELTDLDNGDAFVPVLTPDYFEGPVSSTEYFKAIQDADRRGIVIIPILHEGTIQDYENRLIKIYNIVTIPDVSDPGYSTAVERLVSWLISVRRH